ncbi:MAG: non-ribosomal peptide synthetase, partial [bacterium]|nr:non-ribosomal peptide synthetase [bacterium]
WTGDLGGSLGGGRIEMLGRKDFQVKIRGHRVETGEIETALLTHDAVSETAILIKEEKGDNYLCAYIVPRKKIQVMALRLHLMEQLPEYMLPSHFTLLDKMPLTPTGKIDRKALPEPQTGDLEQPFKPAETPTEKKLVEIYAGVLDIDAGTIGLDSDFFQLGGHSLRGITVTLKIHKELNVKVQLPELFANSTIRKLAAIIDSARQDGYQSIEVAPESPHYPLSPAQKRLYIIQQMEAAATAYNITIVVRLEGELDHRKVEHSFRQLVDRHESFRTTFHMENGEPLQKIHKDVPFKIRYTDATGSKQGEQTEREIKKNICTFNLEKAPLLRVGLIKIAAETALPEKNIPEEKPETGNDGQYILMVDMHHIISDGTSMTILVREFMALYQGETLPPLRLQYKDYAAW